MISLELLILKALKLAWAHGQFDVAEKLLQALETLEGQPQK